MGHAVGSEMEEVYCHLSEEDIEARLLGKGIPENREPDIPTVEKETEELLLLRKAIKKIAEKPGDYRYPEIVGINGTKTDIKL